MKGMEHEVEHEDATAVTAGAPTGLQRMGLDPGHPGRML